MTASWSSRSWPQILIDNSKSKMMCRRPWIELRQHHVYLEALYLTVRFAPCRSYDAFLTLPRVECAAQTYCDSTTAGTAPLYLGFRVQPVSVISKLIYRLTSTPSHLVAQFLKTQSQGYQVLLKPRATIYNRHLRTLWPQLSSTRLLRCWLNLSWVSVRRYMIFVFPRRLVVLSYTPNLETCPP